MNFLIEIVKDKFYNKIPFTNMNNITSDDMINSDVFITYCNLCELKELNFGIDSDNIRNYIPIGSKKFVKEFNELFIGDNIEIFQFSYFDIILDKINNIDID